MTDPQQPAPVPPPAGPGPHPTAPVAPPPGYSVPQTPTAPPTPVFAQPGSDAPAHPDIPTAPAASVPQAPVYQAPPGAFAGRAGGYAAPYPSAARPAGRPALGRIALVLSLIATVVLSVVGAVLAGQIGHGIASSTSLDALENRIAEGDLSLLTPVREQVLWWEITMWAATALGIWALVQGIVAIARRRGRGSGVAAVIIAAIGPGVFFFAGYLALVIALGMGLAQP